MATWVYKDGEGTLIDAHDVTNHLDAGYTLDKNPKPEKKEFKKSKKSKTDDEQPIT